ncbi:MAG: pyridoxamine 5'-phosphate oxidase family protein [Thermomicrobiales bacterium]
MTKREPIDSKNVDRYGGADFPWSRVRDVLSGLPGIEGAMYLGTVRPDGRPHVAGIAPAWFDGDLYFVTGLNTQKARNLAVRPDGTLVLRLPGFDVTLDGQAEVVGDPNVLEELAARYRKDGWPVEVTDGALSAPYSAQTAGPPPWHLFRFRFNEVIALGTGESGGAMRWKFAE